MLVSRSMPDCGAVTRTIAFGGNRWPTNSACWGLRARMTPSRSATVSTLPARNRDPVCRSRAKVFRQVPEIEAGHQHAAAIRIHRGERQGEWQKAPADTGQGRESAGREAGGGDGIPDPLRPIDLGQAAVRAPRRRSGCRPRRATRQTRTSARCAGSRAAARRRSAWRHAPRPTARRRRAACARPPRCCRCRRSAVAPAAATVRLAAPVAPPSLCIRPRHPAR